MYIAEHLFQMIPQEIWREQGTDDGQGHYEGEYWAEKTREELKELSTLAKEEHASKESHPGFTIFCDKCNSHDVSVDITVGFSAESGGWGGVDLDCQTCGESTELWSPR